MNAYASHSAQAGLSGPSSLQLHALDTGISWEIVQVVHSVILFLLYRVWRLREEHEHQWYLLTAFSSPNSYANSPECANAVMSRAQNKADEQSAYIYLLLGNIICPW